MTNLEKFKLLEAEAAQLEAAQLEGALLEGALLERFMVGRPYPVALWSNAANAGVKQWDVTGIDCDHHIVRNWDKRVSNEKVEQARDAVAKLHQLTMADPMKVYIRIRCGDTSAAVPWARLEDGSYGYYATKEAAEEANRLWHQGHDPRPDHFPCDYCRKQTPNSQMVCRRIYVNRGWQDRRFCSADCASYDQFASEG